MNPFSLFTYSPSDFEHAELARVTLNTGGVAILDLTTARNLSQAERNLQLLLTSRTAGRIGLRLDPLRASQYLDILNLVAEVNHYLVVTTADLKNPALLAGLPVSSHRKILAEVTSLGAAEDAWSKIPDLAGVIACGNEAGGFVGNDSSFILTQKLSRAKLGSFYVRGGIGFGTTAAVAAAGASGVILDDQLLLMPEYPLSQSLKAELQRADGRDARVIGETLSAPCRILMRPGYAGAEKLETIFRSIEVEGQDSPGHIRQQSEHILGFDSFAVSAFPVGQALAFAKRFASRFHNTPELLRALRVSIANQLRQSAEYPVLAENSTLARSHGTRFPIVQGPMTRVSDVAPFAAQVADAGALPMMALAMLRAPQVDTLLAETSDLLADKPWGVGILGFVPQELRLEQLAVVRKYKPDFAIIAGGRPDQAIELEEAGISTYLHVPTPELLNLFLDKGANKFIFEGRECGGHIGPLSSFVLWEEMVQTICERFPEGKDSGVQILFAGGIHDALSAAMVSVMATQLHSRGVQVGTVVGTAYLFTKEAVTSGAILAEYQAQAISCEETMNFESGPGHASRCARTSFAGEFLATRRRLLGEGLEPDILRDELEELNLGRLRLASKGIERDVGGNYTNVDTHTQRSQGLYMMGQVATMRQDSLGMLDLHREICDGSVRLLAAQEADRRNPVSLRVSSHDDLRGDDIAIVGMSTILPDANTPEHFWRNVLDQLLSIKEVPTDRWDHRMYYDPESDNPDMISCKWGGAIDDIAFDPLSFGIPPAALKSVEPIQFIALEVVRKALQHAGFGDKNFDREHTSVIVAANGSPSELSAHYAIRAEMRRISEYVPEKVMDRLPEWSEESLPGILMNILAGRIANRFDLGGINFALDAACASSLAALDTACSELKRRRSNVALAVAIDNLQGPSAFTLFDHLGALSGVGQPRPFDKSSDGIILSEGYAALVLKRLEDAEADGDTIYSVIRGIGGSSDGRAKGLTAPLPAGQKRALRRAYSDAGVSPNTLGMLEAHATGTPVGDGAEVQTIVETLEEHDGKAKSCVVGSAKVLIGHTKATAGIVGVVKSSFALHHKVLPPQPEVTNPLEQLQSDECPVYLLQKEKPWLPRPDMPRRAGISAFGFGGTNFHAVLEEYNNPDSMMRRTPGAEIWPHELCVFRAHDTVSLVEQIDQLLDAFEAGAKPRLRDLAFTLAHRAEREGMTPAVLTVTVRNIEDLGEQLFTIRNKLVKNELDTLPYLANLTLSAPTVEDRSKIGLVFPGQGAQYVGMFREAAVYLEAFRESLERSDKFFTGQLSKQLSDYIYPPSAFSESEKQEQNKALFETKVGQLSLATMSSALLNLLRQLGVEMESVGAVAGHSFGEFVALHAAGSLSDTEFLRIVEARGSCMAKAAEKVPGAMAAVKASRSTVESLIAADSDVVIANNNSPEQVVISGPAQQVTQMIAALTEQGILVSPLPVPCAFHSPLFADAQTEFLIKIAQLSIETPKTTVYSNTSGDAYPMTEDDIREQLSKHLLNSVEWVAEVEKMYANGIRTFIELGPRSTLCNLITKILETADEPVRCISLDGNQNSLQGVLASIGQLLVAGIAVRPSALFASRSVHLLDLSSLVADTSAAELSPTTVMLNGACIKKPGSLERVSSRRPFLNADSRPSAEIEEMLTVARVAASKTAIETDSIVSETSSEEHVRSTMMNKKPGNSNPVQTSAASTLSTSVNSSVMSQHMELMQQFLASHERVMASYLGSPVHGGAVHAETTATDLQTAPLPVTETPAPSQAPLLSETSDTPQTSPEQETQQPEKSIPATPEWSITKENVTTLLLDLVSERTGYPKDILGLDQDLEAELGVDSIKRIEVLGSLQKEISNRLGEPVTGDFEELSRSRSLEEIVTRVLALADTDGTPALSTQQTTTDSPATAVSRFIIKGIPTPLTRARVESLSGTYLITEGPAEITQLVSDSLRSLGANPVTVKRTTLTDPTALDSSLKELKAKGSVHGIVHLTGLEMAARVDSLDEWKLQSELHAKSLFRILRFFASDFASLNGSGPARILSATAFGGQFGREDFTPGATASLSIAGAATGLLKTIAKEWKSVRTKSVDFATPLLSETTANGIIGELLDDSTAIEIGYPDTAERLCFHAEKAPVLDTYPVTPTPESDWVVLITGGARGISAAVAEYYAARNVRLILVGRTPIGANIEPDETLGIRDQDELRSILLSLARDRGETPTPAALERELQSILQKREIGENIAKLKAMGAQVEYVVVDVRSEEFGRLLDSVYERYGRIDTVIHGAGVINDKYLADKTDESFDIVFDTKVDSCFFLQRHLQPETLRSLVLFSSIAGRFGNSGQSDYAAANEVLNRIACELDARWPKTHVTAINWGPWSSIGMASNGVEDHLAAEGISSIPVAAGQQFLAEEVSLVGKGRAEVIAGDGPWGQDSALAL